eukprot:6179194-Pleurochrysis_carterae.AAC.1
MLSTRAVFTFCRLVLAPKSIICKYFRALLPMQVHRPCSTASMVLWRTASCPCAQHLPCDLPKCGICRVPSAAVTGMVSSWPTRPPRPSR